MEKTDDRYHLTARGSLLARHVARRRQRLMTLFYLATNILVEDGMWLVW